MDPLLRDQVNLLGQDRPLTVVDVGSHNGKTTLQYVEALPNAVVHGFEPEPTNFAAAEARLNSRGDFLESGRARLHRAALAETSGRAILHQNSHDGTHSLLELGNLANFVGPVEPVGQIEVETVALDDWAEAMGIARIDALKMDIQGAEVRALRGAESMLRDGRIGMLALEVMFQPSYREQSLIWDIGAYLDGFGYGITNLYDINRDPKNPRRMLWADALFLSPAYINQQINA